MDGAATSKEQHEWSIHAKRRAEWEGQGCPCARCVPREWGIHGQRMDEKGYLCFTAPVVTAGRSCRRARGMRWRAGGSRTRGLGGARWVGAMGGGRGCAAKCHVHVTVTVRS